MKITIPKSLVAKPLVATSPVTKSPVTKSQVRLTLFSSAKNCTWLMLAVATLVFSNPAIAKPIYAWQHGLEKTDTEATDTETTDAETTTEQLSNRFAPPSGYQRLPAKPRSFSRWLRGLPLKPKGTEVKLYNGALKFNQSAHAAIIDIDVGTRDLQQCADAVMRLRAEYLYGQKRFKDIRFNFTDGTPVSFSRWSKGGRPRVQGRRTKWRNGGKTGSNRPNFRRYMTMVFAYAGTYSLARELTPVKPKALEAGNVFIHGGFPGHAVLVVDVSVDPKSGKKKFLLAQSYMPAQDMHVLNNPNSKDASPWYELPTGDALKTTKLMTPEWTFAWSDLKRFSD